MKCDNCLNARRIVSENGLHSICCLSEKNAMECLMEQKDHRVPRIMVEPQEISDRNLKMWEDIYAEEKRRERSE